MALILHKINTTEGSGVPGSTTGTTGTGGDGSPSNLTELQLILNSMLRQEIYLENILLELQGIKLAVYDSVDHNFDNEVK